jgi:hypothetical protein
MVNSPNSSRGKRMLMWAALIIVLIIGGGVIIWSGFDTTYIGACHPTLPCKWTPKPGEVACLYTEAANNRQPGDRCP